MEFVDYLQIEDVIELHDMALRDFGGLPGVDIGNLEAKLALPMSGYDGFERFPTIEEKAAVYHYYLASGHCFKDGNKRTSYLATWTFLDFNGYSLIVSDEEVYNWTITLANDETRPPFHEAVNWIKRYIYKQ